MGADDARVYYNFYGIKTDDWKITWSGAINKQFLLVRDYLNEDISATTATSWSKAGVLFVYPHNIKKKYYVEGVIEGQFTLSSEDAQSWCSNYIVDVLKINEAGTETVIASTGSIAINDSFPYVVAGSIDTEIVYPFFIDVFATPVPIGENERLGFKIRWDAIETGDDESTTSAKLLHDNDSTFEDVKSKIPFKL